MYNWVLNATEGTEEYDNALFWELLLHRLRGGSIGGGLGVHVFGLGGGILPAAGGNFFLEDIKMYNFLYEIRYFQHL